MSAFCTNKAWSEFGRVLKAEFEVDIWFLLTIIDNSFSKDPENEQIPLSRLSAFVEKSYLKFYFAFLLTLC